jgi:hypothetical protein
MLWQQIDSAWFWTPPPGSKTKRCNAIPLPKLAQRVLGQRRDQGHVFSLTRNDLTRMQASLRKELEGVAEDFFWHGIRHMVETKLAELRVQPHIRDLLLDHASARSRAAAGYDHHDYEAEMLAALEAWCSHIEKLIRPAEGVAVLR